MNCLASKLREQASKKPVTEIVASDDLLSDAEVVVWLDLREVTCDDIKSIEMRHVAVANKEGRYQGICLWFTCTFPSVQTEPVTLSTEPEELPTHWKQTVIVLPTDVPVELGTPIAYDLSLKQSPENCRRYIIEVTMLDPEEVEHPEYCLCHMTKCILVRAMFEKYDKEYVGDAERDKEKGDDEKEDEESTEKENAMNLEEEKENCEVDNDGGED
ncbi:unnamed protein product [Acanthoscelides obtectus]|nr:unnamed protein product [Acanthoscelides obtectus]CAK1670321.1 Protein arginine N-methyltransferase 6 [Acanthoscelides obtectus]